VKTGSGLIRKNLKYSEFESAIQNLPDAIQGLLNTSGDILLNIDLFPL
jgi:hypothetical protein